MTQRIPGSDIGGDRLFAEPVIQEARKLGLETIFRSWAEHHFRKPLEDLTPEEIDELCEDVGVMIAVRNWRLGALSGHLQ